MTPIGPKYLCFWRIMGEERIVNILMIFASSLLREKIGQKPSYTDYFKS